MSAGEPAFQSLCPVCIISNNASPAMIRSSRVISAAAWTGVASGKDPLATCIIGPPAPSPLEPVAGEGAPATAEGSRHVAVCINLEALVI